MTFWRLRVRRGRCGSPGVCVEEEHPGFSLVVVAGGLRAAGVTDPSVLLDCRVLFVGGLWFFSVS